MTGQAKILAAVAAMLLWMCFCVVCAHAKSALCSAGNALLRFIGDHAEDFE